MLLALGHSPMRQSVTVETEKGTVVTSGFCSVKENLGTDKDKICVPGSFTNMLQAYDNIMKVKQVGDIVIPLHDMEYVDKTSIP